MAKAFESGGTVVASSERKPKLAGRAQALDEIIGKLETNVSPMRRTLGALALSNAGTTQTDVQAAFESEITVDTGILAHTARKLAEIDHVVDLHRRKVYGLCQSCGQKIPLERLRVMPTAVHCRGCQESLEASSR